MRISVAKFPSNSVKWAPGKNISVYGLRKIVCGNKQCLGVDLCITMAVSQFSLCVLRRLDDEAEPASPVTAWDGLAIGVFPGCITAAGPTRK